MLRLKRWVTRSGHAVPTPTQAETAYTVTGIERDLTPFIRFAEVDDLSYFHAGVDDVRIGLRTVQTH